MDSADLTPEFMSFYSGMAFGACRELPWAGRIKLTAKAAKNGRKVRKDPPSGSQRLLSKPMRFAYTGTLPPWRSWRSLL